jgi:DNA-binding NtrC family response regulator
MTQRILAVDDEPNMLRLLERIITERTPYEITTTSNSLEVPQLLERGTFDLVITDLRMPGADGLDILRTIQEQQRQEVVILITAFGTLESATEALSRGVFDYITKPFKKDQILLSVERAMRCQAARRDAARLARIVEVEPYQAARAAFDAEYVRRLSERSGGSLEEIAARSELPVETIRQLLGSR